MSSASDKEIKFLMVLNDTPWFWTHRVPLAQSIIARGWRLTLAAKGVSQAQDQEKLQDLNVRGEELSPHGRSLNPLKQFHVLARIRHIIKTEQPDIIHGIGLRYAFYVGFITRLMGVKPVVFTIAGLGSLFTAPDFKIKALRYLLMPLLRFSFGGKSRFMIFQNSDDHKIFLNAGIITEENSIVIRGSGVDLDQFSYNPYVQNDDDPIILFTSRLIREKGIVDFIEAAKILKFQGVKARFQVAGNVYPDNARSMTHAEMQKHHDEDTIEWLGQCDDMPDLLRRSMMVVLPSYYGEGVPKALLEASSVGRPVITCDTPGCREAVAHEVNGLHVLPQSPTDLAAAIKSLIDDPEKCHCFGAAGRKRMEEDFSVDHVNKQTMAVYDRLLTLNQDI